MAKKQPKPDFLNTYKVEPNNVVGPENTSWDGGFFDTFGDELDHVVKTFEERPLHVWTIVEVDSPEGFVVINGLHRVNRFGYLISTEPCKPEHAEVEFE